MLPEYDGKLEATEYTYFLGVSKASCTKWHTDSAEHPNVQLVLTSLTLLSPGTTSMCIAGKDETWLKEPFVTVLSILQPGPGASLWQNAPHVQLRKPQREVCRQLPVSLLLPVREPQLPGEV